MSKVKWTAAGFARRVMMSSTNKIFIIVEGKVHDRVFYDRVSKNSRSLSNWDCDIRLVEEIRMGEPTGANASGKQAAYRLFDFFEIEGHLCQDNNVASSRIVFMLDRDFENLAGSAKSSVHVIYSNFADVEAEILINGDIRRAIGSAFSLNAAAVDEILDGIVDPARHLAEIWREWLTLLLLIHKLEVKIKFPYFKGSTINGDNGQKYAPSNMRKYEDCLSEIKQQLSDQGYCDADSRLSEAEDLIDRIYLSGQEASLLKGKWLEAFISDWVRLNGSRYGISSSVKNRELTKCCIETLNYESAWTSHYSDKFHALTLAHAGDSNSKCHLPMQQRRTVATAHQDVSEEP